MHLAPVVLVASLLAGNAPEFVTVAETDGSGPYWVSAAFSADGERVAAVQGLVDKRNDGSRSTRVAVWNRVDLEALFGHEPRRKDESPSTAVRSSARFTPAPARATDVEGPVTRVKFSPEGELVLMTMAVHPTKFLVRTGKTSSKLATADEAEMAKFRGHRVEQARCSTLLFLDAGNLSESRRWIDEQSRVTHRNLSCSCFWYPPARAVVHSTQQSVRLLDDATGDEFERLTFENARREIDKAMAWCDARVGSNDGRFLIVCQGQRRHGVWKLAPDRGVTKIAEVEHSGQAGGCAVSPLGTVLALGNHIPDGGLGASTLQLWQVEARRPQGEWAAHEGGVAELKFSPDGKRLVSTGGHSALAIWEAATGKLLARRQLGGRGDGPVFVQISPDGTRLLTVSHGGGPNRLGTEVRLWNIARMLDNDSSQ